MRSHATIPSTILKHLAAGGRLGEDAYRKLGIPPGNARTALHKLAHRYGYVKHLGQGDWAITDAGLAALKEWEEETAKFETVAVCRGVEQNSNPGRGRSGRQLEEGNIRKTGGIIPESFALWNATPPLLHRTRKAPSKTAT